ncbi:MAG: hypothetical protein IPK10_18530 [Bacteroidetes bacterium]|nr:hypothetical protein [Bacteroidota bacterium]
MYASSANGLEVFSDLTFDAVWNSDVSFDENGWYVEMEIPLLCLSISGQPQFNCWIAVE